MHLHPFKIKVSLHFAPGAPHRPYRSPSPVTVTMATATPDICEVLTLCRALS